jgi:hypothetical protein
VGGGVGGLQAPGGQGVGGWVVGEGAKQRREGVQAWGGRLRHMASGLLLLCVGYRGRGRGGGGACRPGVEGGWVGGVGGLQAPGGWGAAAQDEYVSLIVSPVGMHTYTSHVHNTSLLCCC